MPSGVSWKRYLKLFVPAALSMMAGAQTVHIFYRPLDDLEEWIKKVEEEEEKRKKETKSILIEQPVKDNVPGTKAVTKSDNIPL